MEEKMKKIALTIVAVVISMSVGFAQSAPEAEIASTESTMLPALTFDKMSNVVELEEEEEQIITVYDLPELVLEQFKYSELAGHSIISVTELPSLSGTEDAAPEYLLLLQDTASDAGAGVLVRYNEFGKLVSKKEIPFLAERDE